MKQIQNSFGLSVRRACEAIGVARSTFTYKKKEKEDYLVIDEIHRILSENSMYGCPMVHMKLRQRGLRINHKRTERIYKEQGLQLATRKRRKKIASVTRVSVETPDLPGVIWALDFMHDSIGFGRKFKILTAIDPAANYSPLIHSNFSITGKDVAETLSRTCESVGYPDYIQCDNGPEFRSKELDKWCYDNGIKLIFSRPGKPTDNCYIESFNGKLRTECLNIHYFNKLSEAKMVIDRWWNEYNEKRPQKRLKGMTPKEFMKILMIEKTKLTSGRKMG